MKKCMLFFLCIFSTANIVFAEQVEDKKVIYDFKGDTPLQGISFSGCKKKEVKDSAKMKSKVLAVRISRGSGTLRFKLPADFVNYDLIVMNINNRSNFTWKMYLVMPGSSKYSQTISLPADEVFPVELELDAVKEQINLNEVKEFHLFIQRLPKDIKLEIGNISLQKIDKSKEKKNSNVKVLHSFERASSRGKIAGNRINSIKLNDKFATDGKQSLEVEFKEGNDSHIIIPIPYDWSEYEAFAVDINNPSAETRTPSLYFRDGFNKKYTPIIKVPAASCETVMIPVSALKENGIDPEALEVFKIFFWGQVDPVILQFDNFRLIKNVADNGNYVKEIKNGWTIISKKNKNAAPSGTTAQQAAGFVPFTDNYMVRVSPSTIPSPKQIQTTVKVELARDEFEPFIIGLFGLADLEIEIVEVAPLVNAAGDKLTNVNIRYAQPIIVQIGQKFSKTATGRFMDLVPFYQEEFKFTVPKGKTSLLWGTVHAGKTQAPGTYTGKVKVKAKGRQALEYPLTVNVAPFVLRRPVKKNYCMLYTYEFMRMNYTGQGKWPELIKKGTREVIDMRNHGMTCLSPHAGHHLKDRNGHPALPDVLKSLRAAKKYGFTGPFIFYCGPQIYSEKKKLGRPINKHKPEHMKRLEDMVKYLHQVCQKEKLPQVYWLCVDEPNTPDRHALALKANKLVKSLGGKVAQTCHKGSARGGLNENVDLVIGNASPEAIKKYHRQGKIVWDYNNSVIFDFNEGKTRFYYGYLPWIANLDGVSSWTYPHHLSGFRQHPVIGKRAPEYDSKGFPMDNIIWEMVREGIDDYRYLEMGLAKNKEKMTEVTGKLSSMPKSLTAYKFVDSKSSEMLYKNFLTIDQFIKYRSLSRELLSRKSQ